MGLLASVQRRIRDLPRRLPVPDRQLLRDLHEAPTLAYRSRPDVATAPSGTSHHRAFLRVEALVRQAIEPRRAWGPVVDALRGLIADREWYERLSREQGRPVPGYYDPTPWS